LSSMGKRALTLSVVEKPKVSRRRWQHEEKESGRRDRVLRAPWHLPATQQLQLVLECTTTEHSAITEHMQCAAIGI
jgi:hypothetical protein